MTFKEHVQQLEIELVKRALMENSYDIKASAKTIGLSYQGMLNKIRRYKIYVPGLTYNIQRCPSCGSSMRLNHKKRMRDKLQQSLAQPSNS